jgi:hypothetical protein
MTNKTTTHNDELNPTYIFSLTFTKLLTQAIDGEIDLKELAAAELANRGLNHQGNWIGFQAAAAELNNWKLNNKK